MQLHPNTVLECSTLCCELAIKCFVSKYYERYNKHIFETYAFNNLLSFYSGNLSRSSNISRSSALSLASNRSKFVSYSLADYYNNQKKVRIYFLILFVSKEFPLNYSITFSIPTYVCYACGITPERVTSGGFHLRDSSLGQHCSQETSQPLQAVGDFVFDLTCPVIIELQTSTFGREMCHASSRIFWQLLIK